MPDALHATLAGHTAWSLLDADGQTVQSGEHHNLILNSGLDAFGTCPTDTLYAASLYVYPAFGQWRQYLALGTGSAAPVATQTTLSAEVMRSNSGGGFDGASGEITTTYTNNATQLVMTSVHVRVADITVARNLTEYGFSSTSTANSTLSIRELFRDGGGNPIALSVQAGQKLKVVHTLTITLPLGLTEYTVNIDNLGAVTGRGGWYNAVSSSERAAAFQYVLGPQGAGCIIRTADTFNAGAAPTVQDYVNATVQTYVSGTYARTRTLVFDVAVGNIQHHGWVLCQSNAAYSSGWRFGLLAPITKDNTKRLTLNFSVSWGRA